MPLQNIITYQPPVAQLRREEDVIAVLEDARESLGVLDFSLEDKSLAEILAIVEKGKYEMRNGQNRPNDLIDFSAAVGMFRDWRRLSGRGCVSCQQRGVISPNGDGKIFDTLNYCKLHEDESKTVDEYQKTDEIHSPRVRKYNWTGCEEFARGLRELDEVLKDAR